MIKIYRQGTPGVEDGQGIFTQNLEKTCNVGSVVNFEGPTGKLKYYGHGKFDLMKKPLLPKTKIGLLSAGTGITPLLSVATASILGKDGLEITMLYSNKTEDDILCKSQIEALQKEGQDKFKAHHTLTRNKDENWKGLTGRVDFKMFQECGFPAPADDVFIFICGTPGFNKTCHDMLNENGYTEKEMH